MNENYQIRINENKGIPIGHPRQIISPVVDAIPDLKLWSAESLVILNNGIIDLECKMIDGMEKKNRRGIARSVSQKIKNYFNSEEVLEKIFCRMLRAEGLTPLGGFKIEKSRKNPEYCSITTRQI